jgi:DDE_Tnp_1-associated
MPALTCALVEKLETMADPRRPCANRKHPLVDSIIVGFCGVRGGCEDVVEIAEWGKGQEAAVRSFRALPQGIPAQDTFNRVFALLKPTTRQEVLLPWVLERRGRPGDWMHGEGKTLRQTGRSSPKLKALPVVRAGAGQTGRT